MRKIGIGAPMLAISLAGLALLSFAYGNFAPLLSPFPWPKACTFCLGLLLLAASAGLLLTGTLAASVLFIASCAAAWAVVCVPPVLHDPLSVGSWYGFSEAVTLLVGVWTLFAMRCRLGGAGASAGGSAFGGASLVWGLAHPALTGDRSLRVGRILFGGACLVWGLAHFAYVAYTLPFVPTWLPARLPLVYLTGAFHAAAGVGLILGILPRLAALLEAAMIILFGLVVWLPSHFANPVPKWAGSLQNQWSESFVNFVLAGAALLIAESLSGRRAGAAGGKLPGSGD